MADGVHFIPNNQRGEAVNEVQSRIALRPPLAADGPDGGPCGDRRGHRQRNRRQREERQQEASVVAAVATANASVTALCSTARCRRTARRPAAARSSTASSPGQTPTGHQPDHQRCDVQHRDLRVRLRPVHPAVLRPERRDARDQREPERRLPPKYSNGNKTVTITIKPGLKWSDGTPVNGRGRRLLLLRAQGAARTSRRPTGASTRPARVPVQRQEHLLQRQHRRRCT